MNEIIDLAERRKKAKEKTKTTDKPVVVSVGETDFTEEMELNKKKADKLAKERANANKSVKQSYRLNPNDPNNKR